MPILLDTAGQTEGRPRAIRVARPTPEELHHLTAQLGLEEGVAHQFQKPELAPGLVEFPRHLLLRLDLPEIEPEKPLRWNRLDTVLGKGLVLTLEARALEPLTRAWEKLDRPPARARLLSMVLGAAGDGLANGVSDIRRETDALREAGLLSVLGAGGPVDIAREQAQALAKGAEAQRAVLAELARSRRLNPDEVAEVRAAHDRLTGLVSEAEACTERLVRSAQEASERETELGAESTEIIDVASVLGQRRLHRITIAHAIIALVGGMAVSFGALAMSVSAGPWLKVWGYERAHLLGALTFPIGFLILIVGKGELFTENFFVPVTGVISGRGKIRDLLLLWGSTLIFNLVGVLIFAFLATRPGILTNDAREFLIALTLEKLHTPFWIGFTKAIFAGWLMTVLTWLMLGARGSGARLLVLWSVGFLIVAGHFNHVVISASEFLIAILLTPEVTVGGWIVHNFFPALLGNLVGGVVFVTTLGYVQARSLERGEKRVKDRARQR